jgi:hypothetical protein
MSKLIVVMFAAILSAVAAGFTSTIVATLDRSVPTISSPNSLVQQGYSTSLALKKCTLKRYRRPRLQG